MITPNARSVMSGHTMTAMPAATQMSPVTTNSHQLRAMSGTSLSMDGSPSVECARR